MHLLPVPCCALIMSRVPASQLILSVAVIYHLLFVCLGCAGEGGVDGEEEELLDEAGSEDDGVVMFDDSGDSSTDTDRDVRRAVAQDSDGEDVSPGKGRGGARSKRRR